MYSSYQCQSHIIRHLSNTITERWRLDMQHSKVKKWEIAGALILMGLGSLFHFLYDWSSQSQLVGIFSPINESIWEHLKIAFWPILLFAFIEYWFISSHVHNFLLAKALSALVLQGLIVTVFYTYTAFTRKPIPFIDIGTFLLGCFLAQYISYKILTATKPGRGWNRLGLILILINALLFILFTFNPPQFILFQEPNTYLNPS